MPIKMQLIDFAFILIIKQRTNFRLKSQLMIISRQFTSRAGLHQTLCQRSMNEQNSKQMLYLSEYSTKQSITQKQNAFSYTDMTAIWVALDKWLRWCIRKTAKGTFSVDQIINKPAARSTTARCLLMLKPEKINNPSDGFPLHHARLRAKLCPIGRELRGPTESRRQIIIKTLREHRWRETAPHCLMCGWVTATSRAGLTQPISRCATSARLQCLLSISPSLSNFYFPLCNATQPQQWREDNYARIVVSVTKWCHSVLSCARSLESIFTLIWVALLGSHLTAIHLIMDEFKCAGTGGGRKSMGLCGAFLEEI